MAHVALGGFVSVAFPLRPVGAGHRERSTDMITLHEARVAARMSVVPSVATVAEVIYANTPSHHIFV